MMKKFVVFSVSYFYRVKAVILLKQIHLSPRQPHEERLYVQIQVMWKTYKISILTQYFFKNHIILNKYAMNGPSISWPL